MKEMKVENDMTMIKTVQAFEKRNRNMAKICVNMEKNTNEHNNKMVEWKKRCRSMEKQLIVTN